MTARARGATARLRMRLRPAARRDLDAFLALHPGATASEVVEAGLRWFFFSLTEDERRLLVIRHERRVRWGRAPFVIRGGRARP